MSIDKAFKECLEDQRRILETISESENCKNVAKKLKDALVSPNKDIFHLYRQYKKFDEFILYCPEMQDLFKNLETKNVNVTIYENHWNRFNTVRLVPSVNSKYLFNLEILKQDPLSRP